MRKTTAAVALSAAIAGAGLLFHTTPLAIAAPPPAAPEAPRPSRLPVREVVLFSSGVGYFEHFGSVHGDGEIQLQFKTAQINDILKSLVLQDLDKGKVTDVTYPSQDPIAKTLKSFQIDITANPALHDLLEQLRGAKVTLVTSGERIEGSVLGVEKKRRPVLDDHGKPTGQVIDAWFVNLLTGADGGSLRSLPLDDVTDFVLDDQQLRSELSKALAALAQARDQDKKPVTIHFSGQGDRRIRIGYVVETPVWKTSYRLLLNDHGAAAPAARTPDVPPRSEEGVPRADHPAAAPPALRGGDSLQGWAIIENQTDNDWNDVELSLVSGRPISFVENLYQPLYIPRPLVEPELYASLRPQTYAGGIAEKQVYRKFGADAAAKGAAREEMRSRGLAVAAAPAPMLAEAARQVADEPMDAGASIASIASAAKLGELFQYTVADVSLPRQKSAMIPIVTDPIEVERLSIYNASVLPRNPLYGARLKNTTGKFLLQGPVTVLDNGSYAGDARIEDLPPGQERLISYGVDLQLIVNTAPAKAESSLQTGKIVKGILYLTYKDELTQDYLADNKSDRAKTLVIEHLRGAGWNLVEPAKADETTDTLYRFKGKIGPGKTSKLTVREQRTRGEAIAILPLDVDSASVYARSQAIPADVKSALAKVIQLKNAVTDTQRQINEREARIQQITSEQTRIRENMKTVTPHIDYYNRLLKKLDEQETEIDKLHEERAGLQKQLDTQRKTLEDSLAALTVG